MIYTIMKCECCGKEFISKYWDGGYIDHVNNFVGNRDAFANRNNIEDMASEIVFSGNNLRDIRVIDDFLKCFMTWDCFQEDFKNKVKKIVKTMVSKIKNAEKQVKELEKSTSPIVLAMLKEEEIDDAYFDLFDDCCIECGMVERSDTE